MSIRFTREGNEIIWHDDSARGIVGVILPNDDESLFRILYRVFERGRQDKAAEIRSVING
ncbi:MAG: hypothetical protein KGL39_04765 [Patescibacteria group bacterium]|nr:hypothetical protein [Patescibacteria group bacterium]